MDSISILFGILFGAIMLYLYIILVTLTDDNFNHYKNDKEE